MPALTSQLHKAVEDFHDARRRAAFQELTARLTGRSIDLLSYEEVYRKLRASSSADRGLQEIPLDAIIGTAGRYRDFTRSFLPRQDNAQNRWASVKVVADGSTGLPPIEVYQIGSAYFVKDGHHRVSVARQMGAAYIQAYVTEVQTKIPLTPDVQPEELIIKAEYAGFLEATHLDQLRPGMDFSVSEPGQYARLESHIEVHRYFWELELGQSVSDAEAVGHWYDHDYLPLVTVIRDQGLLREFPGSTEADLYLWVMKFRLELREQLGWEVRPERAAAQLAAQSSPKNRLARVGRRLFELVLPNQLIDGPSPGAWRKEKLEDRYLDRLFADILVPLSGEPASWSALDMALILTRCENATLHGLHIVANTAQLDSPETQAIRAEFESRCEAANARGRLALEVGEVALKICERATLADLVVLHLAHPPGPQTRDRLGSGIRTVLRRSPRPVMAVPRSLNLAEFDHILLAYDDSPKAREALFVATYFAGEWQAALTVLTVAENNGTPPKTDFAREYLDFHELSADFVEQAGPLSPVVMQTAHEHGCDVIFTGGYGAAPMVEVMVGSALDELLRDSDLPLLICR